MTATPETDAFFATLHRSVQYSDVWEKMRKIERERTLLLNTLKTIWFVAEDADIRQLAKEAITAFEKDNPQ